MSRPTDRASFTKPGLAASAAPSSITAASDAAAPMAVIAGVARKLGELGLGDAAAAAAAAAAVVAAPPAVAAAKLCVVSALKDSISEHSTGPRRWPTSSS